MTSQGTGGKKKVPQKRKLFSVFVGHLSIDVEERDVLDLFNGCGKVVDHIFLPPKAGDMHKYAFMRYKKRDEALRAIKELNGWPIKSDRMIVDVARECAARLHSAGPPKDLSAPCPNLESFHPEAERSAGLDSIINLNRLKETCLWVNSELAGTCCTGIVKTERIIYDLESKGGASDAAATYLKPSERSMLPLRCVLAELKKWEGESSQLPSELLSQKVSDSYKEISSKVSELLSKSLSQGLSKLGERSRRKILDKEEIDANESTVHSDNPRGFGTPSLTSDSFESQSHMYPYPPSKSLAHPVHSSPSINSCPVALQKPVSSACKSTDPFRSSRNSISLVNSNQRNDEHTKFLSHFPKENGKRNKPQVSLKHEAVHANDSFINSKAIKTTPGKESRSSILHNTTGMNSIEDIHSLITVGRKLQQKKRLELIALECGTSGKTWWSDRNENQLSAEQQWENDKPSKAKNHDKFASNLFCEILDSENGSNPASVNNTDKIGFHLGTDTQRLKIQCQDYTKRSVSAGEKSLQTFVQSNCNTPSQVMVSNSQIWRQVSSIHSAKSADSPKLSKNFELLLNHEVDSNSSDCSNLTKRPPSVSLVESQPEGVDHKPFGFRASRLALLSSRSSAPKFRVNINPPFFSRGFSRGVSSDGESSPSSSSSNTSLSSPY